MMKTSHKIDIVTLSLLLIFCCVAAVGQEPLQCGAYRHVQHWVGSCGPSACDSMAGCVTICAPIPPDKCADDMHTMTEKEYQDLLWENRKLRALTDDMLERLARLESALEVSGSWASSVAPTPASGIHYVSSNDSEDFYVLDPYAKVPKFFCSIKVCGSLPQPQLEVLDATEGVEQ